MTLDPEDLNDLGKTVEVGIKKVFIGIVTISVITLITLSQLSRPLRDVRHCVCITFTTLTGDRYYKYNLTCD